MPSARTIASGSPDADERQRVPVRAALLLPVDRGRGPVLGEQRGVGLRDRAGQRHRDAELRAPARQLAGGPRLAELGDAAEAVGGQRPRRRAVAAEPGVFDAGGGRRGDALDPARPHRPAPGLLEGRARVLVAAAGLQQADGDQGRDREDAGLRTRAQRRAGVLLGGLPPAEVEQGLAAHGEQVVAVGGHLVRVGVLQRFGERGFGLRRGGSGRPRPARGT